MLAADYGAHLLLEEFVDNPFLPLFYAAPDKYAFHAEVHFMLDRQAQIREALNAQAQHQQLTISDYILNKSLLYAEVNLEHEEFLLFRRLFEQIFPIVPPPDLLVYVHATVPRLIKNIQKRGRGFEQGVRHHYLQAVEDIYFRYFSENPTLKILLIHADNVDFVNNKTHYQQICHCINSNLKPGLNELRI